MTMVNCGRARTHILLSSQPMFSGTLRLNLDPYEEFSDEDIIKVISQVYPAYSGSRSGSSRRTRSQSVSQPETLLLEAVQSGGINFTSKERQVMTVSS